MNRSHSKVLLLSQLWLSTLFQDYHLFLWTLGRLKRGTLDSALLLWFQGISFAIAVASPHGARPEELSADHRALFHCLRRVLVSTEICTFPVHIYHPELRGEVGGGGGCRILCVFLPPRSPFVLVVKGQGENPLTDYLLINDTVVLWGHFRCRRSFDG